MRRRPLFGHRLVTGSAITAAAAVVFVAASAVAACAVRRQAAAGPRPVVLLLHGRGQLGRDTARVRADWERALQAGVGGLTRQRLIGPDDVRLVWYADVLDPASRASGCDDRAPRAGRAPRTMEDSGDALQLIFGVTSALFTSLYEAIPEESRSAMRAIVGDVLYLGESWRRCGVERRIESELARAAREGRPVILVAHSFGSLVAYSYLRGNRVRTQASTPVVHRFVTLGSMLGIPELQQLLVGRAGPLGVPPNVRSWVNVRHTADPFALPLADPRSERSPTGVREVVIRAAAADPHDIRTYLRDPAGARAIVWAWCDAFRGTRPAACSDVQRDVP